MSVLILTDKDLLKNYNVETKPSFHNFRNFNRIREVSWAVYFKDNSWEYKIIKSRHTEPELPEEILNEIRYRKLNWILS